MMGRWLQYKHSFFTWWSACSARGRWLPLFLGCAYNLLHVCLGAWRSDHALLSGALLVLYYGGPSLRSLLRWLLPLLLMLIVYDLQRYWVGALRGVVRVAEPRDWELAWFGLQSGTGLVTPAAWCQAHTHPLMDFICGAAYLLFVPLFVLTTAWWCFGRKFPAGQRVMWAYLWLNLAAFVTYLAYPAAPPWYADRYGLGPAQLNALPEAAGAARFDALLGVSWFADYYARNANVFGAIPSLHVAVPFLVLLYAFRLKSLRFTSLVVWLLVTVASVYLNHHYLVDGVAGMLGAVLAFVVMEAWGRAKLNGAMS